MCLDTYDLARGLSLGCHSEVLSMAAVELSERKLSPSWTPWPPDAWRSASSFSPISGGTTFFFFLLFLVILGDG